MSYITSGQPRKKQRLEAKFAAKKAEISKNQQDNPMLAPLPAKSLPKYYEKAKAITGAI